MNAQQRLRNMLEGKSIDRLPVIEWAPWWNLTVERWQQEGLKMPLRTSQEGWAIQRHFGLDGCFQTVFSVRGPQTPVAPSHGAGILRSQSDYERIKPTLYPEPDRILPAEYFDWMRKVRDEGNTLFFFTVEGFFWYPRELFGIEPHLYSFYDEPELLHRMCEDYCEWLARLFEYIGNTFPYDFMSFAEDMSYNNGPMLSHDCFEEFLAPYYRRVIPLVKQLGVPVFIDSDGDITRAVDWYASVGADGMFPLERQAGVDVSLYLKKQPDMFFLGHFDKMCMKHGEDAMREEFERLLPSMRSMHFLPSVDHQTPPDVSLENYHVYVRLLKEYAEKAVR